jgi:hypothetical protein
MEDKNKVVYKTAVDSAQHLESLLFDRLNYFLAGSAFLVTAYAALAVSVKHLSNYSSILRLTYLVNGTGFYLSIFFAIINYLNTRVIGAIFSCIKNLELDNIKDENLKAGNYFNYQDAMVETVIADDFSHNTFLLIIGPLRGLWRFLKQPFQHESKDTEAPHTYMIPLALAAFWLVVFFVVFSPQWYEILYFFAPFIFILLLPDLKLIIFSIVKIVKVAKERLTE